MGTVYKAHHLFMDRTVALKVINPNLVDRPGMVERFRREVQAAGRLSHPNIVAAYDADHVRNTHFLVMEFVQGVSLDQGATEQGPMPIRVACNYARQTALGLQHAFECGMVHRDIKPHNLMLTPEGVIKILDFGLARFIRDTVQADFTFELNVEPDDLFEAAIKGEDAEGSKTLAPGKKTEWVGRGGLTYRGMGTADYIAPEEAIDARKADIRSDVYSLGCTLYRFLTGQVPFPGGSVLDKIKAHVQRLPTAIAQLRPEVPDRLAEVLSRMMAKDPACRFQTPIDVVQALAPFAGLRSHHILVVDDDGDYQKAVTLALESEGFTVTSATDGLAALELLRQQDPLPDLILLDLIMPKMNGWEFMKAVREDPRLASIPVMIISAIADRARATATALGVADWLAKPVFVEELTARISRHAGNV
jgi:serine/threonine protein kinase